MPLSKDITSLATEIIATLRERNETLSTAESITAGELSNAVTSIPGSSDIFIAGLTAYTSQIKISHLGVDPDLINKYTVISEEVAQAMAHGALKTFGTTWAIATTGVAGPGPSDGFDAGTVWIAIAGPINQSVELSLSGEREIVRNATTASAIGTFARILKARK